MEDGGQLLDLAMVGRLRGLPLRPRWMVEGHVSGMHRSPAHGFSIEFSAHREYAPGDDLRYLDWKAFGRTDKYYLKQFEGETNLLCYLLLDASQSMGYRSSSRTPTKLRYAQQAASALCYLALHQQDSVGLAVFDSELRRLVRPGGNPTHLQEIMEVLQGLTAENNTAAGAVFHDLAERLKIRGIAVVLSDLLDNVDSVLAGLKHLRHRRHDVIVMHVLDPAELEFPFDELTLFRGLEGQPDVLAEPRTLKSAYLVEFGRYLRTLRAGCRAQGIDYVLLRTDQSLEAALRALLASRR